MKKNEKIVIALAGAVMLVAIIVLATMLVSDSQKIDTLSAQNKIQSATIQASSTQDQASLEQQNTCGALQVEFASECAQENQQNLNKMEAGIQNCINSGSASADTCSQNFTNDYKGAIGPLNMVNCENLLLMANSCPLLPVKQFLPTQ